MAAPPSPSNGHLPTYHSSLNISTPSQPQPPRKRFLKFLPNYNLNWKGAKLIPLIISISIGIIFNFAIPKPHQLSRKAWELLSIFLTTITGLILNPLPVGAWSVTCLTITVITKTLTFSAAFSAFTNEVLWLIIVSFFFSRGFIKTGLGERLAMVFVRFLGKSTLGVSYGLVLSEMAISPAMPSSTARAGGIFLPIIKSLAEASDSLPYDDSSRILGGYLVQSQLQAAGSSSSLFLTAAAQNLLCLKLAEGLGVEVKSRWVTWFKGACIPSLVTILATPYIVYLIYPPKLKHTPDAPIAAKKKLAEMGPLKRNEWFMILTMLVTVALWVSGDALKISSVIAALLGLSLLLLLGVLDWNDCLEEKSAWDTLVWFGVLVGMATQLTTLGVVPWMSDHVAHFLKSLSIGKFGSFSLLQLAYFFIHYLFASQTAHVGALYSAFLGMHLASNLPKQFSALTLGYITNLFGALTHYSSGQAVVYYGAGYVKLKDVFKMGFSMAIVNLVLWGASGALWWKILHLY